MSKNKITVNLSNLHSLHCPKCGKKLKFEYSEKFTEDQMAVCCDIVHETSIHSVNVTSKPFNPYFSSNDTITNEENLSPYFQLEIDAEKISNIKEWFINLFKKKERK